MKTCTKNLFLLPGLIAGLGLIPAGRVTAQTFTTLYSFTAMSSDGANPETVLILSGNTLFGTASYGGISGNGTVFAVNTDGSGFTNLHSFTALNNSTNSDGATPYGGLILASNTLYGTAFYGGGSGKGAVFAVNTDGTDFTNLHSFTGGSDGANPFAGLILSAYTLYGTARGIFGGPDYGMVFAVNTDGSGFTNLHSFTAVNNYTNSDGANPFAGLILSGNTLYGTTFIGGSQGNGTVFAMNTDGTGFTNLHSLPGAANEGSNPQSRLVLSNNTLYGTTQMGGSSIFGGTVFKVNTDGTGFTNLYNFTGGSDGANPSAGLVLSGGTLYGTTPYGGNSGNGTVFAVNTDGTGFTNLYHFTGGSDGANPYAGLILSGNTLYGTAYYGGSSGNGTVFSLSFAPQLTIIPSGANVILTWPTNAAGFDYAGFTLQSTTNLVSPSVWTSVVPGPIVVNGQYAVTNPSSGTQQFYRLSQ